MVEEKTEKHEHEHHEAHESKTVTVKKSTLWAISASVLLVLLVISIFTGGFGITGKAGANAGNNNANTGNTGGAVDTSPITSNTDLYPSLGPENAKATVIEVADFQCPWCTLVSGLVDYTKSPWSQLAAQSGDLAGAAGKVEQLAEQGKVRFIFVPMSFLGQESIYAAEAAYCAEDQGKFWEMHDAIYKASTGPSEETGKYTKANLEIIAQSISGLDQSKFKTCLEKDTDLAKVQSATQGAGTIASGTPSFFVNGKQVSASWTAIQTAINAA